MINHANYAELRVKTRMEKRLLGLPMETKPELPNEEMERFVPACVLIGCIVLAGAVLIGGCIAQPSYRQASYKEVA